MVGGVVQTHIAGGSREIGRREGRGGHGERGGGGGRGVTWEGIFGARDHCDADITTASPKITNILERRSSPVIKDGAYEDIT